MTSIELHSRNCSDHSHNDSNKDESPINHHVKER
jgi:hypothetical protein